MMAAIVGSGTGDEFSTKLSETTGCEVIIISNNPYADYTITSEKIEILKEQMAELYEYLDLIYETKSYAEYVLPIIKPIYVPNRLIHRPRPKEEPP